MIIQLTNLELPYDTIIFHLIYHLILDRSKTVSRISDYVTCPPSLVSSGVKVQAMCDCVLLGRWNS